MINTVTDLKNRTIVESNTLKSFILQANDGFKTPSLDDILLHDYQIANSATLNQIVIRYLINLKCAWNMLDSGEFLQQDSYFKIINGDLDEKTIKGLDDQTRLIMNVNDEDGTFVYRTIDWESSRVDNCPENARDFINLEGIWYAIVRGEENADTLKIVDDMNDFEVNPNPFGQNPFDAPLIMSGSVAASFNDFSIRKAAEDGESFINNITENLFYKNTFLVGTSLGNILPRCRYILCLSDRLCGLEAKYGENGEFLGLAVHDIGSQIPNLNQDIYNNGGYEFVLCGFNSIDGTTTLFIVFKGMVDDDESTAQQYHYIYLNEDSYDDTYGFTKISTIVTDRIILPVSKVFNNVKSVKEIGDVNIVMTDYGFWDIEVNTTKDVTYSYSTQKEYHVDDVSTLNNHKRKLIKPDVEIRSTDKIVQYDRIWGEVAFDANVNGWREVENGGTHYQCRYVDEGQTPTNLVYPKEILTGSQFVGGTKDFAVYDSSGENPVYILTAMTGEQFKNMLFSQQTLAQKFLKWMYSQVVHPNEGEHYLMKGNPEFARYINEKLTNKLFSGLEYQPSVGMVNNIFASTESLVKSHNPSASTLNDYCTALSVIVNGGGSHGMDWLIPGGTSFLESNMCQDFKNHEYDEQKDNFIDQILDDQMPRQLLYFRPYLKSHLNNDLTHNNMSITATSDEHVQQNVLNNVKIHLKDEFPVSMVLGEYSQSLDQPGQETNKRYPGIDSYIPQTKASLRKDDVANIMSILNAKNAVVQAVKSMPFFSQYNTYEKCIERTSTSDSTPVVLTDATKFDMTTNKEFAGLSNLVRQTGDAWRADVSWDNLRDWLFPMDRSHTADKVMKAFVRTQMYRPMFFNAEDHETFTSDSSAYWCKTRKSHVRFDGRTFPLEFQNRTWNVVASQSGLGGVDGEYDIADIEFNIDSNSLQYDVVYPEIPIENGKFVHDDVEYYAIYGQDGRMVVKLEFNQFQGDVESQNDWIDVVDDTFAFNGAQYKIDGDVVKLVSQIADFTEPFAQEIQVDEHCNRFFTINGIRLNIVEEDDGSRIEYAQTDDNRLVAIDIMTDGTGHGYGTYGDWSIEFHFSDDWSGVQIVRRHHAIAMDSLVDEWCKFDDSPTVNIDQNKNWDWWLLTAFDELRTRHPDAIPEISELDGVLYDGGFLLDNANGTKCSLELRNEIQDGYVVGKCMMNTQYGGGHDKTIEVCTLFNKDNEHPSGVVVRGDLVDNIIVPNQLGGKVFLMKDTEGADNCFNAVWVDNDAWNNAWKVVQNVGEVQVDQESGIIRFSFKQSEDNAPQYLKLTPIKEFNPEIGQNEIVRYWVDMNLDGSGRYAIRKSDDSHLHVLVDNARYIVNLQTNTVDMLEFKKTYASTMDFTTHYDHAALMDGLLNNVKLYMMNEMAQQILDSREEQQSASIVLNPERRYDKYIDLFGDDVQSDNFNICRFGNATQQERDKFKEVYKNNIKSISDDAIKDGNAYKHLKSNIDRVFGEREEIGLVDRPSIQVRRVNQTDKFSYEVLFDLSMRVGRDLLDNRTDLDGKYIVGNAKILDMKCVATFVPKFNVNGEMQYDATYSIVPDSSDSSHKVEFSQIVCFHDGQPRSKFVEQWLPVSIKIPPGISHVKTGIVEDDLAGELVSSAIVEMFNNASNLVPLMVAVNNEVDGDVQVLVEMAKNKGLASEIWDIQQEIPPSIDPQSIVAMNRGKVTIDGEVYGVSGDECWLDQLNGNKRLKLVKVKTHGENGELVEKFVPDCGEIADIGELTSNFTLRVVGDTDACLVYKDQVDHWPAQIVERDFQIDTAQIHNLDIYKQQIQVPGYVPQLTGTLHDLLVHVPTPDSTTTRYFGEGLDDGSQYQQECIIEQLQADPDSGFNGDSIQQEFQLTGYEERQLFNAEDEGDADEEPIIVNNGWIGVDGKFTVEFYGFDISNANLNGEAVLLDLTNVDSPTVEYGWTFAALSGNNVTLTRLDDEQQQEQVVVNKSRVRLIPKARVVQSGLEQCLALHNIPLKDQMRLFVRQTTRYTPIVGDIEAAQSDDEDDNRLFDVAVDVFDSADEGQSSPEWNTRYVISFRVGVQRSVDFLAVIPDTGEKYIQNNLLIENNNGTCTAKNAIRIVDFDGTEDISGLTGGCVKYPTNLDDPDLQSPDDYATKNAYIQLIDDSHQTPAILSGAMDYPFTLNVIHPDRTQSRKGDVFDRCYQIEQTVYASHHDLSQSDYVGMDDRFTMDKASTTKSIRRELDFNDHLGLTHDGEVDVDPAVPESMRASIDNLVVDQQKWTDEDIAPAMGQLQRFLLLIDGELKRRDQDLGRIADLCLFNYDATVSFPRYNEAESGWDSSTSPYGLFGWRRDEDEYRTCLTNFNNHLYGEFVEDYSHLGRSDVSLDERDYGRIVKNHYVFQERQPPKTYDFTRVNDIFNFRDDIFSTLQALVGVAATEEDLIDKVFQELSNEVRYINAIPTSLRGHVLEMYVADETCHLMVQQSGDVIAWHYFDATGDNMANLMDGKKSSMQDEYFFSPSMTTSEFPIARSAEGWVMRAENRDLSNMDVVPDSYTVMFKDDDGASLWYMSQVGCYVRAADGLEIVDIAYEHFGDTAYVLFKDDQHLYLYNNMQTMADSKMRVTLLKENATRKMETMHTAFTSTVDRTWKYIYLDYDGNANWSVRLYGSAITGSPMDTEVWESNPGNASQNFTQYNMISFGDSLFDNSLMKFQNISKNKDMFDLIDVSEVDGCFYGLFLDHSKPTQEDNNARQSYTVFKVTTQGDVVQRMPYKILYPRLYRTADNLYSLYVLMEDEVRSEDGEVVVSTKPILREISVPGQDSLYTGRTIDIFNILKRGGYDTDGMEMLTVIMSKFKVGAASTKFFVLTNKGLFKVGYQNNLEQLSIDRMDGEGGFKSRLLDTMRRTVMQKHMDEMHHGTQSGYFDEIAKKVNQFSDGFNVFDLLQTEFSMTQDVGVIPDSRIDDIDDGNADHRDISIQVSTDVLRGEGMHAETTTNPGIITAAVSNPATIYDDDNVFTKSQRNPLIEGTEFYDYIYDQDGNALMDLYQIPFIYQVNSNNTYDLWIDIPTTRTKYLNRVTGTLKSDLTSQVLAGDSYQRRNFLGESLPNNLDESTTRLKVFIDKKYVSVGNIELVEICGNTIPLQIYRDAAANDGLYDSIALESRWNGEVEEIVQPEKDINKVALEFECYGTDGQSIHIQGKTLIHHSLDEDKYGNASGD